MHIDQCFDAQFKFGVHLGCKKTWPTSTCDYQSALETNNRPMKTFYYWENDDGNVGGGGGGGGVGWPWGN